MGIFDVEVFLSAEEERVATSTQNHAMSEAYPFRSKSVLVYAS